MSRDHARVRAIVDQCAPGMVFADDAERFARRARCDPRGRAGSGDRARRPRRRAALRRASRDHADGGRRGRVRRRRAGHRRQGAVHVGLDRPAQGRPQHARGCCAPTSRRSAQVWPFLRAEPPVLVDWLPWSHTFGGNHNFNLVLAFGGTLYIDDGKPAPRAVRAHGRRRCARSRPTVYFNVPAGSTLLAPRSSPTPSSRRPSSRACVSCSTRRRRCPRRSGTASRALAAGAPAHDVPLTASWGIDRDRAAGDVGALRRPRSAGASACRCPASAQAGAARRPSSRSASAGPNVTPGYHGDRRRDGGGLRRGGLLPDRGRRHARRRGRPEPRPDVRRPPRRELQARHRARGSRSAGSAPRWSPPWAC